MEATTGIEFELQELTSTMQKRIDLKQDTIEMQDRLITALYRGQELSDSHIEDLKKTIELLKK